MSCRLFGTKPLSEPTGLSIGPLETNFNEISLEIQKLLILKVHHKCRLRNRGREEISRKLYTNIPVVGKPVRMY